MLLYPHSPASAYSCTPCFNPLHSISHFCTPTDHHPYVPSPPCPCTLTGMSLMIPLLLKKNLPKLQDVLPTGSQSFPMPDLYLVLHSSSLWFPILNKNESPPGNISGFCFLPCTASLRKGESNNNQRELAILSCIQTGEPALRH